ncbi:MULTISPECIES: replication initiator protein A [Helcococcus]|uniref:Replication initiator protein A n=1 Tax=Helcococcus bovis TaxID=3153252 RepID=A0ABW9F5H2_9FIRM
MEKFKKYSKIEFARNNFIKFPNWLQYLHVSSNTKLVYMYILDRYQLSLKNKWIDKDENIFCYFTRKTLAKKIGISDRTVISSIQELEELGLLITIHQFNLPSRIYLLEPTDKFLNELIVKNEMDNIDELDNFINETQENYNECNSEKISPPYIDSEKISPPYIDGEKISPPYIDGEKISPLKVKNFHPSKTNINQTNNIYNYPSFNKEKEIKEGQKDIFDKFNLEDISDEKEKNDILQIIKYLKRINNKGITLKGLKYENIEKYIEKLNLEDIKNISTRLLSAEKIKSIDKYLLATLLDYLQSKEYMNNTENERIKYKKQNNNEKSLAVKDNRMTKEERLAYVEKKLEQRIPIRKVIKN